MSRIPGAAGVACRLSCPLSAVPLPSGQGCQVSMPGLPGLPAAAPGPPREGTRAETFFRGLYGRLCACPSRLCACPSGDDISWRMVSAASQNPGGTAPSLYILTHRYRDSGNPGRSASTRPRPSLLILVTVLLTHGIRVGQNPRLEGLTITSSSLLRD